MQNHSDMDIFESTNKNTKINEKIDNKSQNFFMTDEFVMSNDVPLHIERSKRLNDYDFNLLKEDAYKDISDDLFKLEYKISKTEEDLKNINSQIQSARDIHDYNLIEDLTKRKKILEEDYEALLAMYNDKSLSAKITDGVSNLIGKTFKNKISEIGKRFDAVSEVIISRMPKKISKILELKKTLIRLENINKSVDELINMNIPYGENIDKYRQLSKYIIKANTIQSEISKYVSEG